MASVSDSEAFRSDLATSAPFSEDDGHQTDDVLSPQPSEPILGADPYDSDLESVAETSKGFRLLMDESGEIQIQYVENIVDHDDRIRARRRKIRKRTTEAQLRSKQKKREQKKLKKKGLKKKAKTPGQVGKSSKKRHGRGKADDIADLLVPEVTTQFAEIMPTKLKDVETQKKYQELRMKVKAAIPEIILASSDLSIEKLLKKELDEKNPSSAFYLMHLGFALIKHLQWVKHLPRALPYYAVKCNPDPFLVRTLLLLGTGLDCASRGEIDLALSFQCPPEKIIFANPCKKPEDIKYAREKGIMKMTFDNIAELDKVKACHPEAEMIVRILSDDSHSIMAFGSKFGATIEETEELFEHAKELGVKIVGVSFHVGSGCLSAEGYINTLTMARAVFDSAKEYGFNFTILDIGGGWPGVDTDALSFTQLAIPVAQALDDLFGPEIEIIAEPGRYFAAECVTLATNVIARRGRQTKGETSQKLMHYYVSDGVYGSFNNIFFDHAAPTPSILKRTNSAPDVTAQTHSSTLFGPTCDSMDVVCKDVQLPDLAVGDWLYFMNMGAYTRAAASSFNGICPPNTSYII